MPDDVHACDVQSVGEDGTTAAPASRFAHVVLVGCGHMGGALIDRWAHQDVSTRFSVIDRDPSVAAGQAPFLPPRLRFHESLQAFERDGDKDFDALLLGVRPLQIPRTLKSFLPLCAQDTVILSLAAGVSLDSMRALLSLLSLHNPLLRVMPSIPVAIAEGIVIAASDRSHPDAEEKTRALFSSLGVFALGSESNLDRTTGLWGSGPGYVFLMLAAFEQAALALGVEPLAARRLAVQSLKGASLYADKVYSEKGLSPRALVASIALEGGTTEAGLAILDHEQSGLCALLERATQRAYQHAQTMAHKQN